MATPTTPVSRRGVQNRNLNANFSRLTGFFSVRKRGSESQDQAPFLKKRRSAATDGSAGASPVSVASSPDVEPFGKIGIRQYLSPVRCFKAKQPTDFGNFDNLPTDIVTVMLNKIPYSLLGSMAMTSSKWKQLIRDYVNSAQLEKRWLLETDPLSSTYFEDYSSGDPFFAIGVLLRKLSFENDDFSMRIQIMRPFIEKVKWNCEGVGRMLHGFIFNNPSYTAANYGEMIAFIFSIYNNLKMSLDHVLMVVEAGRSDIEMEMQVRRSLHALFLNNRTTDSTNEGNRYLLSSLLQMYKPHGTNIQSRLIFLLYAPTVDDYIDWECFGELVINTEEEAILYLQPLANALRALLLAKKYKPEYPWSKYAVFNIMEEITTFPTPWSMNTFVALLLIQPQLIPIAISTRMTRSHEEEAGDMISTMKLLLQRWHKDIHSHLNSAFISLKLSLSLEARKKLKDQIWKWFHSNIRELKEQSDSRNDMLIEFESQIALIPLLETLVSP